MPVLNLHLNAADLTEALCNIESVSGNEAAIADSRTTPPKSPFACRLTTF